MISDQRIIEKIQVLKQVQPSSTWVGFCRSWLEQRIEIKERIIVARNIIPARIATRSIADEPVADYKFSIFDLGLFRVLAPSMVVILLLFVGLIGAGDAVKNSMPGDVLFPLKVVLGKARLVFTPKDNQLKFQIEITNNRLNELNQLVKKDQNTENVVQAVKQLNQELIAVKRQLPKLVKSQKLEEMAKIAELAKTTVEITNKVPISASIINSSSCSSFASSSCVYFSKEENQELPIIQTMKMAREIVKDIEKLLEEGSLGDAAK